MRFALVLAIIFGIVSPKITISTVMTTVDTHAYLSSPATRMTSTEPIDEAAMLTKLLPMRIAESVSSKRLIILTAIAAFLEPPSLALSRRIRLQLEYAISEEEK